MSEAYSLLDNPLIMEPAMGRRKARRQCPCANCDSPVIITKWVCKDCWKKLPKMYRRALNMGYQKRKFFKQEGIDEAVIDLWRRHRKIAARCIKWTYDNLTANNGTT